MIGNETYANIVAALPTEWATSFNDDTGEYLHTPEGFRFLGCGAYRMALLGPDGVVYKKELFPDTHCNKGEAQFYAEVKVEGFRLAACNLLGEVLAMEYIVGDDSECWDSHDRAARYMREAHDYYDVAGKQGYNWHAVNGECVLTDYSYGWHE